MVFQYLDIILTTILYSPIRVVNEAFRMGDIPESHFQGPDGTFHTKRGGDIPAENNFQQDSDSGFLTGIEFLYESH